MVARWAGATGGGGGALAGLGLPWRSGDLVVLCSAELLSFAASPCEAAASPALPPCLPEVISVLRPSPCVYEVSAPLGPSPCVHEVGAPWGPFLWPETRESWFGGMLSHPPRCGPQPSVL